MFQRFGAACAVALMVALAGAGGAQARTSVYVGVGPVIPVYPPPPPYYHHHYYPAPVYVVPPPPPPPVVYVEPVPAPPPTVVFTQPPAPVVVDPAGPAHTSRDGRVCREYQRTVMIGNVPQQVLGTACQQPDGTWRMMN